MSPDGAMTMRVLRPLDAIVYGLAATVVCLAHPSVRATPLGEPSSVFVIPLAGVAIATFALPAEACGGGWAATVWRLKLAAMSMVGLAPFVPWWWRAQGNAYFALAAALGVFAAIWYAIELTSTLAELARTCAARSLLRRAVVTRVLLLYLVLAPAVAVAGTFVGSLALVSDSGLRDLRRLCAIIPASLRFLGLLPLIEAGALAWECRTAVARGALCAQAGPRKKPD